MKVPGLMLKDAMIHILQSYILIEVDRYRKPEEITIQHIGFRKSILLWFHFFTGRDSVGGEVRPGRADRSCLRRPNWAINQS